MEAERAPLCLKDEEAHLIEDLREAAVSLVQEQEKVVLDFMEKLRARLPPQEAGWRPPRDAGWRPPAEVVKPPPLAMALTVASPRKELVAEEMQLAPATARSAEMLVSPVSTTVPKLPHFNTLAGKIENKEGQKDEDDLFRSLEEDPEWRYLAKWYKWWTQLSLAEEPKRKGPLARLVYGQRFNLLTILAIASNAALVLYQADLTAREARAGLETAVSKGWITAMEVMFVLFFLTELVLKLAVHKFWFFCNEDRGWNVFDTVTIVSAVMELLFTAVSSAGFSEGTLDPSFLRVLRVFRLTRSLRILRSLHFVQGLRQLMDCIVSSFASVFWCIMLLLFINGIFSVFILQTITLFWQEGSHLASGEDPEKVLALEEHFGTVADGMFTLLKVTSTGAEWGPYYDYLRITGLVAPAILVFYILIFIIAGWNIVTSLFIEKALALAQPDIETQMLAKKRQDLEDAKELMHLISTLDEDKSGTVSLNEFKRYMEEPRFRRFLELKDIDIKDAELFFHMLEAAVGNEEILLSVIVDGLMRMRGVATNLDLQAMNFTIHTSHLTFEKSLQTLQRKVQQLANELHTVRTF